MVQAIIDNKLDNVNVVEIVIINLQQTKIMKVLITGGSGLLGSALTKKLLNDNIPVVHLTRTKSSKNDVKNFEWDWAKNKVDERAFDGVTDIIHLAGAGIADRPWTNKRKQIIIKSRVLTARLILETLNNKNIKINSFISASGTGYYGAKINENIYNENDSYENDFLGNCCMQWEKAVDQFNPHCRVVKLRLGVILAKNDGALPKISTMINKGLGSPIGSGMQYMPWIHLQDAVNLFYNSVINDNYKGTYNAVASEHINNKKLTHEIAEVLNKKIKLPNVPSFVLKLLYGELSDTILKGVKVSNDKVKKEGYNFRYDQLKDALQEIYT